MTDPNATAFVPTAAGHPMLANLDPVRLAPPIFVGDIGERDTLTGPECSEPLSYSPRVLKFS
jgi:hypothetical protein